MKKNVLKIDVTNLSKKEIIKLMENIIYEKKYKKGKPIEPKYW